MKKLILASSIALTSLTLVACGGGGGNNNADNNSTIKLINPIKPSKPTKPTMVTTANGIKDNPITKKIPKSLGSLYQGNNFNRYTSLTAPNGKPIHIVAQNKITDEQILKAKNVLLHYLTDYKGSQFGSDKKAVANKMADNGALLTLLNGADDGKNPVGAKVQGQPLYQNEIQVEGGKWYMAQNYEHRDASYEEILHWVHLSARNPHRSKKGVKQKPMGTWCRKQSMD